MEVKLTRSKPSEVDYLPSYTSRGDNEAQNGWHGEVLLIVHDAILPDALDCHRLSFQ